MKQKKIKIENEWGMPGGWRNKRSFFKLIPRTQILLKELFPDLTRRDIESGYLTNTVAPDDLFREVLARHPNAKSAFRSIRVFEGDFEDPGFDWYHLRTPDFNMSGVPFSTETIFMRGTKERLRGLHPLHSPFINPDSYLIVESYAFSDVDLRDSTPDHFGEIASKLVDQTRVSVSELLILFKIATANIFLKSQSEESSGTALQFIAYAPFEYTHNIFTHSYEDDYFFLRKGSQFNTHGVWKSITEKERPFSDFTVTYTLLTAIELRLSGNLLVPPVLCHTALENFLKIIEANIYNKNEKASDKFKLRMAELEKRIPLTKDQLYYKNLYIKYVYPIRNECAHSARNISPFLANYCIWITKTLIDSLLTNEQINKMEGVMGMTFSLVGHPREFIENKTKELDRVYGQNLKNFALTPDQNKYSGKMEVRR